MKKLSLVILLMVVSAIIFAQSPNAILSKAITSPIIDGVMEDVWNRADSLPINLSFQNEIPTLGEVGETNWRGLWDDKGLFILVTVTDDAFFPDYAADPPGANWDYDKPELFFDVNSELKDGLGPNAGSGHYWLSPGFTDGKNDGTLFTLPNGVKYAFKVTGSNYIAEYFIPYSWIVDKDGFAIPLSFDIGFDVTIIDRDPGEDSRKRAVWSNTGANDESWNNMDDCGTLSLEGSCCDEPFFEIYTEGGITQIDTDNGLLQMFVHSNLPTSIITWKVENLSGKAYINNKGVLSAFRNGEVKVIASTEFLTDSMIINISNQVLNISNVNLLKDGDFSVSPPLLGDNWRSWAMNDGTVEIVDGVCKMTTGTVGEAWELHLYQKGWQAYNDSSYVIMFTVWSDVERSFQINLEDPINDYARLGYSDDPESNGTSDWIIPVTTSPVTWTLHTTMCCLTNSSEPSFIIKTANHSGSIFLDNVGMYATNDFSIVKLDVELPAVKTLSCGASIELIPMVYYSGPYELSYSWSPTEGLSNPNIANPIVTTQTDKDYTLTVTAIDADPIVNTVSVKVLPASETPSICAVNVNENDKNVIVLKKENVSNVESYLIYKESLVETDKYDFIGELPYSENAVFVDTESNAKVQSNSYKVAIKDICGSESSKSTEHKTIHLSINQGIGNDWNLIWEKYSGAPISNYKIFRGTSKLDLAEIGNTSGNNTTFTDETSEGGDVYYQIVGVLTNPCSSLKSTDYSSVRSNIISNVNNSVQQPGKSAVQSFIYPNPAKDRLYLNSEASENFSIEIYNSIGNKVLSFRDGKNIDISGIAKGIYLVKLIENGRIRVCRFVKE